MVAAISRRPSTRASWLLSLAVAGLWCQLPMTPAFARDGEERESSKPDSGQADSDLQLARINFQRAIELEQGGGYAQAIRLFREIGRLKMTPQVRYHIGFCEERLGNLLAALGSYRLALQGAQNVGALFAAEVTSLKNALEARIPHLSIKLNESARGAQVRLDGVSVGLPSLDRPLPVDPGSHRVTAKLAGRPDFAGSVTIAEGEQKTVWVAFVEDIPIAPPPAPALTPPVRAPTPPVQPRSGPPVMAYVLGATGGLGLVVGTTLYALREGKVSDIEAQCGGRDCSTSDDPEQTRSDYEAMKQYHWASQISFGVGLLSLGTAAYLWFSAAEDESAPMAKALKLRAIPSVGTSHAGLTLHGSF